MDEQLVKVVSGFGVFWLLITVIAYFWMQTRLKAAVKFEYDQKVKLIDHGYNEQLAKFKNDLEHESELAAIKLNAELRIANVKFSTTFIKQAEAIATTYEKIIPLLEATRTYIRFLPSPDRNAISEKLGILDEIRTDFLNYFQLIRIYIPPTTVTLVDRFISRIFRYASMNDILADMHKLPGKSEQRDAKLEWYGKESDDVEAEVNQLMETLIENFQSVLGVQGIHKEEKNEKSA